MWGHGGDMLGYCTCALRRVVVVATNPAPASMSPDDAVTRDAVRPASGTQGEAGLPCDCRAGPADQG